MASSRSASRRTARSARPLSWLVSCEHGGARVPAAYASLFADAGALLASHRGFDRGAYALARALSARLEAPLHASRTTRLLVDLNRSPHHPRLFSERTASLSRERQRLLLAAHYWPYRRAVEDAVADALAAGRRVVHVSAHSFVPVLAGRERRADVGVLYDPSRHSERALAAAWRDALLALRPELAVRRNAPYRGVADGLVTHLRRRFAASRYAGLELEVNQRFVDMPGWRALVADIAAALAHVALRPGL
jgi:predicted N-formylglutamate amidohydrolase